MRKFIIFLFVLTLYSSTAFATDSCVSGFMPHAAIAGKANVKKWGYNIYDAALYTANSVYKDDKPFALTLTYRMNIKGRQIAQESERQIIRLGMTNDKTLIQWREAMNNIFPDVKSGDAITGIYTKNRQTVFCQSGREIGRIKDKSFGNYFFGIWLNENAENETLRRKLTGKS